MMNEKNLKPLQKGQLTREEAKRRGSSGGRKSALARQKRKILKEGIIESMKEEDWDAVVRGAIERAKTSNKGFVVLRDTIGQKPAEHLENTISFDFDSAVLTEDEEEE
ncbi:MAG: hypothetical protein IJJ00_02995 [Erysipelotrichaceae bacterium]|nr:hypothetical protein [Erysipelotrichaceae bacterium]